MRIFLFTVFCAATLWGQGGGGVQFRDWTAPAATGKPAIGCGELRSLTSFDLSCDWRDRDSPPLQTRRNIAA